MRRYQTISIPFPLVAITVSIAIHLFLCLVPLEFLDNWASRIRKPKILKIAEIITQPPKDYRMVGKKNGDKNFMPNFERDNRNNLNDASESFGLEALNAQNVDIQNIRPIKKTNVETHNKNSSDGFKITTYKNQNENIDSQTYNIKKQEIQKDLIGEQTKILKELGRSQDTGRVLSGKGFALDFVPPEGVSEDELNTAEKIYFSFHRRTFIAYVGSFIKTYNDLTLKRPKLKEDLESDAHHLAARATFDKEGNIQLIQIIKSSVSDNVHLLFEETLKGIRSIPNPPKDMLESDGTFTIYFQLRIN